VAPDDLAQLDKTVAPDLAGGVYCRLSTRLNPFLMCQAFAREAQRLGALVLTHREVTGIVVHHGRVHGVKTGGRTVPCLVVVNAAGPNAARVAAMVGVHLPVVLNLGVLVVTERLPRMGIRIKGECTEEDAGARNLDPLESRYDVHFVFSQTTSGNCLIGRSGQRVIEPERFGLDAVTAILHRACRFIPSLARATVLRTFSGIRPYSPDLLPILGPVDEPRGYVVAAGFGDKGIALGPAGAALVARSILEGYNTIPARFLPSRFSRTGESHLKAKGATGGDDVRS